MSEELHRLRQDVTAAERAHERLRAQRELVANLEERSDGLAHRSEMLREEIRRLEHPGLVAWLRLTMRNDEPELTRARDDLAADEAAHRRVLEELDVERERQLAQASTAADVEPLRARLEAGLRALAASPGGLDSEHAAELRAIDLRRALRAASDVDHAARAALAALRRASVVVPIAARVDRWRSPRRRLAAQARRDTIPLRMRDLSRALEAWRVEPLARPSSEPISAPVFLDLESEDRSVQADVERIQIDIGVRIRELDRQLRA
jgi:hypothetical protein